MSDDSIDLDLQIDQICDAFEHSWQNGQRPRIEDFLNATLGGAETQFQELLELDLDYRRKLGEAPSLDEYASRFPQFSELLKKLDEQLSLERPVAHLPPPPIPDLESFELVGEGSFGTVWKAWDVHLKRCVAVKTPIRTTSSEAERELFRRESQIVARLKHPYVVPVYHAGEVNGRLYIVSEFVSGRTLRDLLAESTLAPVDAALLCGKIADAIQHAHELGIVHRDLKPANILIDDNGDPHVMDFGLAKLLDTNSTIGTSGAPLGTLAYMSPEQAAGRSAETDARSDIYSLGTILYESVSGKPPFTGGAQEVLHKVLSADPPRLSSQSHGVHGDLETICHKCLSKVKSDRYDTAGELGADLLRFLNREPILARPLPRRVKCWRWMKRKWRPLVAGLAVVVSTILLIILMPPKQSPPATRKVHVTTNPPGAFVTANYCNPMNGEPDDKGQIMAEGVTPLTMNLKPGRYQINVTLVDNEILRMQRVHRTVPGLNGEWPSRTAAWERSREISSSEIEWETIDVPPTDVTADMVYIAGTEAFDVDGPGGRDPVTVLPFFVAAREFTIGDYYKIRPDARAQLPEPPNPNQDPEQTLAVRYDFAEGWAEESGCRLLTDLEFAYLSHLAAQAQAQRPVPTGADGVFAVAGGSSFDEIPTEPPIRGILTGYAEWTSTWPHSPVATIDLTSKVDDPQHPERFRIIRGGTINSTSMDYPRHPESADCSDIYDHHPHVGFRLARSISSPPAVN